MTLNKRQRGLSLISWMVVIGVVVFFAMVGLKSLPIYLNHYKIKSIMHSVAEQPTAATYTPHDVNQAFMRRFDIDMVKHVDEREIRLVGAPGGKRTLVLEYEVRVHMFYNIDTVYVFKENVPLKS